MIVGKIDIKGKVGFERVRKCRFVRLLRLRIRYGDLLMSMVKAVVDVYVLVDVLIQCSW